MKSTIRRYKNVAVAAGATVEDFCILGKPPRGKKDGETRLVIGTHALIRAFSVLYAGSTIGRHFTTGTRVSIREGNIIKDNVSVGTASILESGNRIGNNVRIHSGCFMEMAVIEDDVFVGPCVVMLDDPHPPCPRYKECVGGVTIRKGARIGGGTVLLPGVTIGAYALVGGGSVVTRDVPAKTVVAGNPARVIKRLSELKCKKKLFKVPYDWCNK